ncbi:MAG: glycosyltransferase [Cyanobacteriota bacterium]|nr:glycosyltransferase [Cyanobacteriota bacterium]
MQNTSNLSNYHRLISVAICTHNRAERLQKSLEALKNQSLSQEVFEVLVIDNASTDQTQKICDQYSQDFINFHYVYESILGLSKARNTAIKEAKGKYIAYLDDDAIPCQGWLEAILDSFENVEPSPIGVGGPIYGIWEIPTLNWVEEYSDIAAYFTTLNYGSQPCWFPSQRFPYGANMAYQREALEQVGGFCEQLGRKGQNLLSQEELLLNLSLEQKGEKFYYNPKASVEHWISKERINLEWLMQRSYWQGRSEAISEQLLGKSITQQRQESLGKVVNLRQLIAQVLPNQKRRIITRARIWRSWGYFLQVWSSNTSSV